MEKVKCLCCGKIYTRGLDGLFLSNAVSEWAASSFVCSECCEVVGWQTGFIGQLKASTYTNEKFIRAYLTVKPDREDLMEKLKEIESAKETKRVKEAKRKETINQFVNTASAKKTENKILTERKKNGYKEKSEEEYTCTKCGAIWYNDASDATKNIYNVLNSNVNRLKDLSQCPKCGSRASTHKTVTFLVDKKGNVVE